MPQRDAHAVKVTQRVEIISIKKDEPEPVDTRDASLRVSRRMLTHAGVESGR